MRLALRAAALAGAALALPGCPWATGETPTLPRDRSAAVTYVALGDSTVEGVGASGPEATYVNRLHDRLRAVYPNARVANLGVGGATSADVVGAQLGRAIDLRPQLVTLSIGPNDITGRVPVERYEKNLETIFSRLAGETTAVIVANLIPDLAVTPRFRTSPGREAVGQRTVGFNEALARKARAHGVELVDIYAASREEVPRRPELVWSDGYHPSDLGYQRWAELLWAGIERRIAVR